MAGRLGAAAGGVSAVALLVLAGFIADLPAGDSTATEVADYFDDEHVAVMTSVYLQGVAIACFVFFVGGAAAVVRHAGEEWLAAAALAAGTVFAALWGLPIVVLASLAYRATDDGSVAQSLFDIALLGSSVASFPAAALIAALGVAALKTAVFPRWHGLASLGAGSRRPPCRSHVLRRWLLRPAWGVHPSGGNRLRRVGGGNKRNSRADAT